MDKELLIQAIIKFVSGIFIIALLLFLPAGTIDYFNAWLLMGVLFIPMFIAGVVMMFKNPDLLRKRLNAKEKEGEQKGVIAMSGLMFVGGFVIAGLDYRFGWLTLPKWIIVLATVLFLCGHLLFAEVLRENTYLSRTVEVQENQKVIDTGLYGIVRHPMYLATIILFLSMPLILGSLFSLLVFLIYPVIIAMRIRNEERVLTESLEGYEEYKERVRYKVIPFLW